MAAPTRTFSLEDQPEVFLSTAETSRGKARGRHRNADPRPLVRVLDYAQRYAAAIDWSELRLTERMLEETNAFVPPDVAEERGLRLQLPT